MTRSPYPPFIAELIDDAFPQFPPLGPGEPRRERFAQLQTLAASLRKNPVAFPDGTRIVDRDMAACCVAGLWLWNNFLDESHALSQEIDTAEGSYWHGVMHRREGDFSNAKYWFRRVGRHPIFEPARVVAADLIAHAEDHVGSLANDPLAVGLDAFAQAAAWNPNTFIDLCERAARDETPAKALLKKIAAAESDLLLWYCYANAIGKA